MPKSQFIDYGWTFHAPAEIRNDGSTALMIIDEQYNCVSPDYGLNLALGQITPGALDYFHERNRDIAVPTIQRLLSYFRAEGLPVVHVCVGSDYHDYRDFPHSFRRWVLELEEQVGMRDMFWTGNPTFAVLEEIAPLPDETVICKRSYGAFNSTHIDQLLRELGITSLVITGTSTNHCVETTARDAADRGYESVLVDEGTVDYDQASHDASLRAFHQNFGNVARTAEDVIEAMEAGPAREADGPRWPTPAARHDPTAV